MKSFKLPRVEELSWYNHKVLKPKLSKALLSFGNFVLGPWVNLNKLWLDPRSLILDQTNVNSINVGLFPKHWTFEKLKMWIFASFYTYKNQKWKNLAQICSSSLKISIFIIALDLTTVLGAHLEQHRLQKFGFRVWSLVFMQSNSKFNINVAWNQNFNLFNIIKFDWNDSSTK